MSSIVGLGLLSLIASYDIACQWMKNVWTRVEELPEHLYPNIPHANLIGKIPKFHFDAHQRKNHAQYSFSYTRGAGRVDGEGIERLWSSLKSGVPQTTEMGPGSRRDTLDDFCGFSNWRKMVGLSKSITLVLYSNYRVS